MFIEPKELLNKLKRIVKSCLCRIYFILGRVDEKLLILADGRSGTTWLAKMMNPGNLRREMFEPFDVPKFINSPDYQSEFPFPGEDRAHLGRQLEAVVKGDYISAQVTYHFPRVLYKGLVIKDVNAHLILDQVMSRLSGAAAIFILRHPLAVADSKARFGGWWTEPKAFIEPPSPLAEHLRPLHPLFKSTTDPYEKFVLIWCVAHWIAFKASSISQFSLVFYEHLAADPLKEIERLYTEQGRDEMYRAHRAEIGQASVRKSRVTIDENTIQKSREGRSRWQDEWPAVRIERSLAILSAFGLDHLYGKKHYPLMDSRELKTRIEEGRFFRITGPI